MPSPYPGLADGQGVQQLLHPANPRIGVKKKMPAIGYVRRTGKGFEGNLNTPSIKSKVAIVTNAGKTNEAQPDYLVFVDGAEVGGAWIRQSRASGCDYVSLSIAAPEFGPRRLYANLGKAGGQNDGDVFAIIWNPID
jgi:uncharacterized protein (DUF736 family)